MTLNLDIDEDLLQQAQQATGLQNYQAVVETALRLLLKNSPASRFDDLEQDPVFGIWQDRKDMEDSAAWVRSVRQSQMSYAVGLAKI